MSETPANGRELVAAGRLTALKGSVEITDRELVQMSAFSYRGAERVLQQIADANPHLIFTTTRDLISATTRVEWEPREHHLLRDDQPPPSLVERIKSAELRVGAARTANELAERRVRSLEEQLWEAKRHWETAKRRVTAERKLLTQLSDERAIERTYPELDMPPVETRVEIVHAAPRGDLSTCPCCGRSPFELPRSDRMSVVDHEVTCDEWQQL